MKAALFIAVRDGKPRTWRPFFLKGHPGPPLSRRNGQRRTLWKRRPFPAGGRPCDGGDGCVRNGHRQARCAVRGARQSAEVYRGLLSGNRACGTRRIAGFDANALWPRRHAAAPPADRESEAPDEQKRASAEGSMLSLRCAKPRVAGANPSYLFGESTEPCGNCDLSWRASNLWTARSSRRKRSPRSPARASGSAPSI